MVFASMNRQLTQFGNKKIIDESDLQVFLQIHKTCTHINSAFNSLTFSRDHQGTLVNSNNNQTKKYYTQLFKLKNHGNYYL